MEVGGQGFWCRGSEVGAGVKVRNGVRVEAMLGVQTSIYLFLPVAKRLF